MNKTYDLLTQATSEYRAGRNQEALQHCFEALSQLGDSDKSQLTAHAHHLLGQIYQSKLEYELALHHFNTVCVLAENSTFYKEKSAALYHIGLVLQFQAKFNDALRTLNLALETARECKNTRVETLVLTTIGAVYSDLSEYSKALYYHHLGREGAVRNNDDITVATCDFNTATVCWLMHDYAESIKYYELARVVLERRKDNHNLGSLLSNLGLCYEKLGDADLAIDYYKKAHDISVASEHWLSVGIDMGYLSGAYFLKKEYNTAMSFRLKAIEYNEKYEAWDYLAYDLWEMGNIYMQPDYEHANIDTAETYMLRAVTLCEQYGTQIPDLHNSLSLLYEKRGDFYKSLMQVKKHHELETKELGEEAQKSLELFKIKAAIADAERESQEQRLRVEQLERETQRQHEELSSKAIQIVHQSEMLAQLRTELERVVNETENATIAVRKVRSSLKELPDHILNWENFYIDFQKVYPTLVAELSQRIPTLTSTETRVCCLVFIGLSTREIASLLFISQRTVDIHRSHIRRKLNIEQSKDLKNLLQQFTQ